MGSCGDPVLAAVMGATVDEAHWKLYDDNLCNPLESSAVRLSAMQGQPPPDPAFAWRPGRTLKKRSATGVERMLRLLPARRTVGVAKRLLPPSMRRSQS